MTAPRGATSIATTPPVEHDEPIAMPAAKHTGVLGERRDDVLDDVAFVGELRFLVGEIHPFPAGEPDAQHYGGLT